MAREFRVNITLDNNLLPDDTNLLPEQMLTYQHYLPTMTFISARGQWIKRCMLCMYDMAFYVQSNKPLYASIESLKILHFASWLDSFM